MRRGNLVGITDWFRMDMVNSYIHSGLVDQFSHIYTFNKEITNISLLKIPLIAL
jgi:hypothetical protein